jgi:predicted RNase H-like nuclease
MMRAWAAVGGTDQAVFWARRVVAEAPEYGRLAIDVPPHPAFAKLRSDPRYLEVRRQLGLPPLSDTAGTSPASR